MKNVYKSLKKTVPPAIFDPTDECNDIEAIEEKVAGLDEDVKNQCLVLFFKFLSSNSEVGKVCLKRRKRNHFINDKAFCGDSQDSPDKLIHEEYLPSLHAFLDDQAETVVDTIEP